MKFFKSPEWIFILVFSFWLAGMAFFTHISVQQPFFFYKHKVDTVLVFSRDVNIKITISIYQPDSSQCWGDPFVTASNDTIKEYSYYNWIAVSRDLINCHVDFGDIIYVQKGDIVKKFIVKDLMSSEWFNKIDILIPNGNWKEMIHTKDNPLYEWFHNNQKAKIIKIEKNVKGSSERI